MHGDVMKLLLTALGSGGLLAVLLRVIGPALKLNASSSEASGRAIEQWEELYAEQKRETAAALEAQHAAEARLREAEARISQLEQKAQP